MVIQIDTVGAWLAVIAGIIGSITVIFTFFWKFFIKPKVVEEIKTTTKCAYHIDEMNKKADKIDLIDLKNGLEENKKMIEEIANINKILIRNLERSIEADKHILQGVFACLDGLKQLECNGNVSAIYKDIQDYLIHREDINIKA